MDANLSIAGLTVPVFSLSLVCGALLSLFLAVRRTGWKPGMWVDLALGAGAGAVVGGRIEHVALHWDYFGTHADEIVRVTLGGLTWHGAVIGGLIGLWLAVQVRRIILLATSRIVRLPFFASLVPATDAPAPFPSMSALLDALTPALPLLAFAGWLGCYAATCAWGKEVATLADFPAWAVGWTRDVFNIYAPRYSTQFYGMALAALLFALAWLLTRRTRNSAPTASLTAMSLSRETSPPPPLPRREEAQGNLLDTPFSPSPPDIRSAPDGHFWLLLALLSVGIFFIGFWRADPVPLLFGLRADQVADGLMTGWAVAMIIMPERRGG